MNSLNDLGKFIVGIIVLVSIYLLVSGKYEFSNEISFPFFSIVPKPTQALVVTLTPGQFVTMEIYNTVTTTPVANSSEAENWDKEGNGDVEFSDTNILIKSDDATSIFTRRNGFHDFYVELVARANKMNSGGRYSLVLRRVDSCQLYDIGFSKIDDSNLKIEISKFFCNEGRTLLNYTIVPASIYNPNRLMISVEGGNVVSFSINMNDVEVLKIQDTNDFIWRGDFGLSVENGEVEFVDVILSER